MARARFPHLLGKDCDLWQLFLDSHPNLFDVIDYDIRVGAGRPAADDHPDHIQRMAIDLSQRRIDCLGKKGNTLTIVEVTMSAGLKAIGQLQSYPILYRETYPTDQPIFILLVANRIQSDIQPVLDALQIPFWTPPNPLPD